MLRFRTLLLPPAIVLAALAATLLAPAVPAATGELPPAIKAPGDTAQFRRFVLDNGIKVILVSDPKFNKSSVALVQETGAIDDPADHQGLSHFLEHMILMGSDKYPNPEDFTNFVRANGGYRNASTWSDHTDYRLEISHEAFPAAVDRMAQIFIAPRFDAGYTAREVNAVHNEAMRHLQNDDRRMSRVTGEVFAPGSGEALFSTGNKDTLAGADAAIVRKHWETHYAPDRMAVSLAGKAGLDELEKLARESFGPIAKRALPPVERVQRFLPPKAALRIAYVEPIKDVRRLHLIFAMPAAQPDFASRPAVLAALLIGHPGSGGLLDRLKRDGLANRVSADEWERTRGYGSMEIDIDLTPAGREQYRRVLAIVAAYLDFLRAAPFPAAFYAERARIAQLNETYANRGEGADFAMRMATAALYYPLDVAERAGRVWGAPDEAAYRKMLASLVPANMLAVLQAKGVPVERTERIYKTRFSYAEETGAAFEALVRPAAVAGFALPGANGYMPGGTELLAERPSKLIAEPGLTLYYAQDTEFQRPETALVLRFVPVREVADARGAALLRLFDACLGETLEVALGEARLAGVHYRHGLSVEGLTFDVSGFGDSPLRFAGDAAARLRDFSVSPERYAALKDAVLRGLRSAEETEANALGRQRQQAMVREKWYLPQEEIAFVEAASFADVQAYAKRYLARGTVEAVIHGNLGAEAATAAGRAIAAKIGAGPAPADALLRRRHVAIAPGENLIDAGAINGANSIYIGDYVLPDDSARTRAAATVIAVYVSSPFYTELRTRQQLGYIVGSGAGASGRERYFTFVIQSSTHAPDDTRKRAETEIDAFPDKLRKVSADEWKTLIAGARTTFSQKPKSIAAKAALFWELAFEFGGDWDRREAALRELDSLTPAAAADLLAQSIAPATAMRRTILLNSRERPPAAPIAPTFTDRAQWKTGRTFR